MTSSLYDKSQRRSIYDTTWITKVVHARLTTVKWKKKTGHRFQSWAAAWIQSWIFGQPHPQIGHQSGFVFWTEWWWSKGRARGEGFRSTAVWIQLWVHNRKLPISPHHPFWSAAVWIQLWSECNNKSHTHLDARRHRANCEARGNRGIFRQNDNQVKWPCNTHCAENVTLFLEIQRHLLWRVDLIKHSDSKLSKAALSNVLRFSFTMCYRSDRYKPAPQRWQTSQAHVWHTWHI